MKAKYGIGAMLVVLLILASSIAPAIANTVTQKDDFHPGIHIGIPREYEVEKTDVKFSVTGDINIGLANVLIKTPTGELIDTYVLTAWKQSKEGLVGLGTILIPDGKGGWKSAETDMAITTSQGIKTHERIITTGKQTVGQHYQQLDEIVSSAAAYKQLLPILARLREAIASDLQIYDKAIGYPIATLSTYTTQIGILSSRMTDEKYLSATASGEYGTASVDGYFRAWIEGSDHWITYSGSTGGFNGNTRIHPWYTIQNLIETPVWGYYIRYGGIGYNYVEYYLLGGLMVSLNTYRFQTGQGSVPIYLSAWASGDYDFQSANLNL